MEYIYIAALLIGFIAAALLGPLFIPVLIKLKFGQSIREIGPKWHEKKSGTPTMGGVAFLLAACISILTASLFSLFFISSATAISLVISLLYAVSNALIGVFDDLKKLKRKENAGLTPKQKILLQLACAVIFLFLRRFFLDDTTTFSFSFGEIDVGFIYYPLAIFILLGIVNCANLTDGIDGLASSVAFSIGVSLFYISAALNIESCVLSSVIIGSAVGFLIFNLHPAKIFMGDTGSLFFGALVCASAFSLKNPLLLVFVAGVYVIEGVSVILQVLYYKLTHKRIFKMAPLHHHFEKCGWSENKICIVAIILTFTLSIPAYIFYLP